MLAPVWPRFHPSPARSLTLATPARLFLPRCLSGFAAHAEAPPWCAAYRLALGSGFSVSSLPQGRRVSAVAIGLSGERLRWGRKQSIPRPALLSGARCGRYARCAANAAKRKSGLPRCVGCAEPTHSFLECVEVCRTSAAQRAGPMARHWTELVILRPFRGIGVPEWLN